MTIQANSTTQLSPLYLVKKFIEKEQKLNQAQLVMAKKPQL